MPRPRTLRAVFEARLGVEPDARFVSFGDRWFTFAELNDRSDRLAAGLTRTGLGQGDRIALLMANRIEMVDILLAVAKLGAVQVPLNYWLKGPLLEYQLRDCEAKVLVVDELGYAAAAAYLAGGHNLTVVCVDVKQPGAPAYDDLMRSPASALAAVASFDDPDGILSILYTSGTTSEAKGCLLSSGYYVSVARAFGDQGWVVPGDRLYSAFSLFHTSGQILSFTTALTNFASVSFASEFHASSFLREARQVGATMLIGVGSMAHLILAQPPKPEDSSYAFRLAFWAPLPVAAQLEFERRFATPVTVEAYGQTECVPITISALGEPRQRTSSGRVSPSLEVRIVNDDDQEMEAGEPGEIVVRPRAPQSMFSGYWNKPAETALAWRNLWHHTGDFGRIDSDRYLTFVDRKRDVIRRRGENISSVHIEDALRLHPAVAEVAVCAVPSEFGDDDIKACVVLADAGVLTAEELFNHASARLPYYAIPRFVQIRSELPKNSIGRVLKQVLKDEAIPVGAWDLEKDGLVVDRHSRRSVQAPATIDEEPVSRGQQLS